MKWENGFNIYNEVGNITDNYKMRDTGVLWMNKWKNFKAALCLGIAVDGCGFNCFG
ncbi:MAG: hypothetical protein ACLUOI_38375 [Eisenbergiella sp.]